MDDSKEYIIRFFADRWETVHELIRCKECIKKQLCIMYRETNADYGYCSWAERRTE